MSLGPLVSVWRTEEVSWSREVTWAPHRASGWVPLGKQHSVLDATFEGIPLYCKATPPHGLKLYWKF